MRILAGDIGGTKTHLALFEHQEGPRNPVAEATYPSREYGSLDEVVQQFLAETGSDIDRATFGVAGPVVAGRSKITNLPWLMEEQKLAASLSLSSVTLLNDLEAIANGVPALLPQDLHTLHSAEREPQGAIAIIAPGTGLGEAFLTYCGDGYQAHPSEGGHAEFAPVNELEIGLLRYLLERHDHVSYERVCSGSGIPNLYAYLRDTGRYEEPAWLAQRLAASDDPTPVIVNNGLDDLEACPICVATLDMFVAILATEAGNMALKVMATGGVYLAGGIPPRILPALERGSFLAAFRDKGRLADVIGRIPIHVITNRSVALIGSARHCLEMCG
jgi:glucokinase